MLISSRPKSLLVQRMDKHGDGWDIDLKFNCGQARVSLGPSSRGTQKKCTDVNIKSIQEVVRPPQNEKSVTIDGLGDYKCPSTVERRHWKAKRVFKITQNGDKVTAKRVDKNFDFDDMTMKCCRHGSPSWYQYKGVPSVDCPKYVGPDPSKFSMWQAFPYTNRVYDDARETAKEPSTDLFAICQPVCKLQDACTASEIATQCGHSFAAPQCKPKCVKEKCTEAEVLQQCAPKGLGIRENQTVLVTNAAGDLRLEENEAFETDLDIKQDDFSVQLEGHVCNHSNETEIYFK